MTGLAKSFNQIHITTRRVIQMTFITKQAGLLRSARSWGVLGLLLALVVVGGQWQYGLAKDVIFTATNACLAPGVNFHTFNLSNSGLQLTDVRFLILGNNGIRIVHQQSLPSINTSGTLTWVWNQTSNNGVYPDTYMAVIAATVSSIRVFYTTVFKIHPATSSSCSAAPNLAPATFAATSDQFGLKNGNVSQILPSATPGLNGAPSAPIAIFDANLNFVRGLQVKLSQSITMGPNEVRCWGWDKKKYDGSPAPAGRYLAVLATNGNLSFHDPALYAAAFTFNPNTISPQLLMCSSSLP